MKRFTKLFLSITIIAPYLSSAQNTFPNNGGVGIGTMTPSCELEVKGHVGIDSSLTVNGNIRANRITSDSAIAFGDSSIYLNHFFNQLYWDAGKGGVEGLAIGNEGALAEGYNSVAIGPKMFTGPNASSAICMGGSGLGFPALTNDLDHSLMVGFNSDVPTFFVSSPTAGGSGSYGRVGIGLNATSVQSQFKVETELSQQWTAEFINREDVGKGLYVRAGGGTNAASEYALLRLDRNVPNHAEKETVFQVNGKSGITYAREIKVDMDNWPDYVFDSSYVKLPLYEVETYIEMKGHLPGVPSAEEVKNTGLSLGETDRIMMEKLEEMTLYMIELKKENERLRKRIEVLENDGE